MWEATGEELKKGRGKRTGKSGVAEDVSSEGPEAQQGEATLAWQSVGLQ